ncbi:uncharacterized protein LOC119735498 [Patiria miniata]|uniref:F-box domain-containing protein n=1 Tax=Patiria miniata TaxID=46514 RepID=A0A914ANX1_PATMI|nr:uncharacterized protein LOC119735498 [Patiria miniata]
MANDEISESDSESHCSSVASIGSSMYAVPANLLETIFQRLNASDLCSVASCSRWLRDATNRDSLWRTLCQSRGWEHYGTTTDLAKIASYGPSEQGTGASEAVHDRGVTFQNDRIVTDGNAAGLTSTCRWKCVYMRAYHLHSNWTRNLSHFKELDSGMYPSLLSQNLVVDGDLLALCTSYETVHVFDIRKGTLECVIREDLANMNGALKIKDAIVVVFCSNGIIRSFDVRTGQMLQVMEQRRQRRIKSSFFDGEFVVLISTQDWFSIGRRNICYINVWGVQDGKRRLLTMDEPTGNGGFYALDYRNKLLAAVHSDNIIRVWDAKSGKCLHELECREIACSVKLGDNVIVGFSADHNNAKCVIHIWNLDTGEYQKEISCPCANRWDPYLTNNLIMILEHGRVHDLMFAYDLRGRSVTKKPLKELIIIPTFNEGNGSKFFFSRIYSDKRQTKEFLFEASSSRLVRLLTFKRDLGDAGIIWMDEIRLIRYNLRDKILLIHHYW